MAIDEQRLRDIELHYGGMYRDARRINSPHDPRPTGGDRGGDRMDYQNYAPGYAAHLPDTAQVVVEMGIFKGTGLALWKDLYPDAEVIGLDLDLDRYHDHTEELIKLGAFKTGLPEVYEFDEFEDDSWDMLAEVLPAGCVDVWVDDACHDARAIIQAFRRAKPFMAPGGVYIMEDNADVYDRLREEGDIGGSIHQYAQRLTIVCLNG